MNRRERKKSLSLTAVFYVIVCSLIFAPKKAEAFWTEIISGIITSLSISQSKVCRSDGECESGFVCNSVVNGKGNCQKDDLNKKLETFEHRTDLNCRSDSECNAGYTCRSKNGGGAECRKTEVSVGTSQDQESARKNIRDLNDKNDNTKKHQGSTSSDVARTDNNSGMRLSKKTIDISTLTNSVMNQWRSDFEREMGYLISRSGCSRSVNLVLLTNSVMNGWRSDFKREMGALVSCCECSHSVNHEALTNSVMNGWRSDFEREISALVTCIENK